MGALTCDDSLVVFDFVTKVQHTKTFPSQQGLIESVVFPMNHFCITGCNDLLKFQHEGQINGDQLVLDGMKALRFCRWKDDNLLLLFADLKDQRTCLALLDSRGMCVSKFNLFL